MKRSPIWDQLAHTPVLDVIAVEHDHNKVGRRKCTTHQTLAANDTARSMDRRRKANSGRSSQSTCRWGGSP